MDQWKNAPITTTHQTKLELTAEVLVEDKFGEWSAYKIPAITLKPGDKITGSFVNGSFEFFVEIAPSVAQVPSLEV